MSTRCSESTNGRMMTRPGSWVLRYSPRRFTTPTWPCCTMLTIWRSASSSTMMIRPATTRPTTPTMLTMATIMLLLPPARARSVRGSAIRVAECPSAGQTMRVVPCTAVTSTGVPAGMGARRR